MPLDPVLQQLLSQFPTPVSDDLDIAAMRVSAEMASPAWAGPDGPVPTASTEDREIVGPAGQIRMRIHRPIGEIKGTLLHFYGGGFILGNIDMVDPMARRLARDLSMVVVTSSYRLAPENPFPAGFNDCLFAARWVLDNAGKLGGEASPVVLSGESAGGNMAAAVALMLRDEPGPKSLAAQLLINPALDLRTSSARYLSRKTNADPLLRAPLLEQMYHHYAGSLDRADPRMSPLAAKDLAGLPPAVIAISTVDPLHDETVAYAERLREAKVRVEFIEFDTLCHGFYTLTEMVPVAGVALQEMLARLQTLLSALQTSRR